MGFGKRPSTSPPEHAPAAHAPRALADEVWQGASSPAPNAAALNARLEQRRAAMEARHAQAQRNAQTLLPEARTRPFFLIPDPCWNGPTGAFLMTALELYPYDDWNVMFLAADERTAAALDIAPHPNGDVAAFVQAAERTLDEIQLDLNGVHNEAGLTRNFAAYDDARADAREQVKMLAGLLARKIAETWQKTSARPCR